MRPEMVERLCDFIKKRHDIYRRRDQGKPEPWTADPILRTYRFCNVYRELDRVTVWISDNWRTPHLADPDLWFAMVVARFINWPPTLQAIGYPVPWDPERFLVMMARRKQLGRKVYTGAYMVRADREHSDKAEYQAAVVLGPLWAAREDTRPYPGECLDSYHNRLMGHHGMGSFMAAQVVADLKYEEPLRGAGDWWTFAASGPGSRRGLNRVMGLGVDSPWTEADWRDELGNLMEPVGRFLSTEFLGDMHAQDLQNCLCEFDKYERVRLGEGKPRSRFRQWEPGDYK